ncbi:glycosyltransferase family 9 protein [bacterium]
MRGNGFFRGIDKYAGIPILYALYVYEKVKGIFLKKNKETRNIKKILVIKFSAVGDAVLLIPCLRNIKKEYPHAELHAVGTFVNKEAFSLCKYIDKVFEFNIKGFLKNPFLLFRFIKTLNKESYDIIIDYDQWLRLSALLAYFVRSKKIIGFKTPGQYKHFLCTNTVVHRNDMHELENFLRLLIHLDILSPDFNLDPLDFYADDNLGEKLPDKPYILVHPGCGANGFFREWDIDKYIELIELINRNLNIPVVINGTNSEEKLLDKIINNTTRAKAVKICSLCINSLYNLVNKSCVVVSGNTSIMHIAASLDKPAIAIHGPTNEKRWGPIGEKHKVISADVPCRPCLNLGFEYACKTKKCLNEISTEMVYNEVKNILKN